MKASKFFWIFGGMALIPFLLAYIVLKTGMYSAGETAKGEFLSTEIAVPIGEQAGLWRIVAQLPSPCDKLCSEMEYSLTQIPKALGKIEHKVETYLFGNIDEVGDSEGIVKINQTIAELDVSHLYLVDPFGNAILKYELTDDRSNTIKVCKDVIADLKKLIKYSRAA